MTLDDRQHHRAPRLDERQRRLVEQAIPRVESLARRLVMRIPHLSLDDLVSAGYEGLVQAAQRYDPQGGTPFVAFAHYRARGAMLDAARKHQPALRRRRSALRAFEATQTLLEREQAGLPRPDQGDPRTLRERVEAAADLVQQATAAVLLSRAAPEDPDTVENGESDAETQLLDEEQQGVLREELAACSDEQRALLEALYWRGVTMAEYARQVGKNRSTVFRMHQRTLRDLARRIQQRLHARPGSGEAQGEGRRAAGSRDPPDS